MNLFRRICRKFGWRPIKEGYYHSSFHTCVHHWNRERYGQCPKCAINVLQGVDYQILKEHNDEHALDGCIRAIQKYGSK